MDKDKIANTLRAEKQHLHDRFHVSEVGLFGSYMRNDQTDMSDVDVLVDFDGSVDLFDLVDMEEYLESKLNRKVDVVIKRALRPAIGEQILREVVYL